VAVFTVDWEPYYSFKPYGKFWETNNPMVDEPTNYLLDLLRRHNIKAIFYVVGWLRYQRPLLFSKIVSEGHIIGDHTYYHKVNTNIVKNHGVPFRAPRWHGEKRLYSGGFWFRVMPYWWLKREVENTRTFFVHPHDVILEHPECGIRTFDRRLGLKTSRDKLERLCREVTWEKPSV
jgi:hypothetical protein